MPNLTVNIKPADPNLHYQEIELFGDFDKAGYENVKEQLETFIRSFQEKHLVLNFSGLNFINSEGIGLLMMLHAHLTKQQKSLAIIGIDKHVKEVFSVIGLLSVLKHYESVAAFVQTLQPQTA